MHSTQKDNVREYVCACVQDEYSAVQSFRAMARVCASVLTLTPAALNLGKAWGKAWGKGWSTGWGKVKGWAFGWGSVRLVLMSLLKGD